jgi:hypothetical protein
MILAHGVSFICWANDLFPYLTLAGVFIATEGRSLWARLSTALKGSANG